MTGSPRLFWIDEHGEGRNRYVLFRREFHLSGKPEEAVLSLFVDTRYRLFVNGQTVVHGPCRFMLGHPCLDSIDLRAHLKVGSNCIGIVANSLHCVTFQSERSTGGVYVAGAIKTDHEQIDLGDWTEWRAVESPGHNPQTHCLSFAIGPAEALDLREMPARWSSPGFNDSDWLPVTERSNAPWGELTPRPIPMLDESGVKPASHLGTWSAEPFPGEKLHSLLVTCKGGDGLYTKGFVAFQTNLLSPEAQEVTLATWWGDHFLNGKQIHPKDAPKGGMRREVTVKLDKGWNRLLMAIKLNSDFFDFTLGVPEGIELAADPSSDSTDAFLVGGPWEDDLAKDAGSLDWSKVDLRSLPSHLGAATTWPKNKQSTFPLKQRGWRTFHRIDGGAAERGASAAYLFEFQDEVLARPLISYSAKAGTTVDLFYAERLTPDGLADVYHEDWGLFMTDRFFTDERQTPIHTFHPRGFKYLEVFVTGDIGSFRLHGVKATRAEYPVQQIGRFECASPLLNRIWQIGAAAQRACMEDAFLDCPWRERGLYAGDMLVQFHVNLATFGDHALFLRSIQLLLQRTPPKNGGNDYSAITVIALREYWRATDDLKSVEELLPLWEALVKALLPPDAKDQVLLDATHVDPYIDICRMDKGGVNCALNCFIQGALEAAAELFYRCGRLAEAQAYRERAERMAVAIRSQFWDEANRCFTDQSGSGPSIPANTLPLYFEIATKDQAEGALRWLEAALPNNLHAPSGKIEELGVNAYFSYYMLQVLYQHGKVNQAIAHIERNWGPMVEAGAWATWEYLLDTNSRCHAWAASPTHYLSTRVLGLRQTTAGDPNRFVVDPEPGNLTWARGDYPHLKGTIHVEWEIVDGKPRVRTLAPPGVTIEG